MVRGGNCHRCEWLQTERSYILMYLCLQILENKLGELSCFPIAGNTKTNKLMKRTATLLLKDNPFHAVL